jgi:L-cysteine:1D-myo-inositol 2-amino-2-deoxy-alpha-D-glucopyranoside ligase
MSKSLGNLVFAGELLKEWEPEAVRLAVLSNHYRAGWDWHDELMPVAQQRLASWRKAGRGAGALAQVRDALDSDLDTLAAITAIDMAVQNGDGVDQAAALLGVHL